MNEQQHISPDGLWRWDGTQWLPNGLAEPSAQQAPSRKRPWWVLAVLAGVLAAATAFLGATLAFAGWVQSHYVVSEAESDAMKEAAEDQPDQDEWVVVTYDVRDGDPAMLSLLKTEFAADGALQDAGAGFIDGNEVGQGIYETYYVGEDREEMWKVLQPILADSSVAWKKVELLDGLEDEHPIVKHP